MRRFLHRKLSLLAAIATLLSCAAMAQQPQDPGKDTSGQAQSANQSPGSQQPGRRASAMQRQRQHMAMLAQKLNLTDAQKQQFQQINQSMFRQGMAIRRDSSLTEDQKKEKIQALRKQSHQEMFGVLTQEQKDQLKQMREQHQKEQGTSKTPGDQASAKQKPGAAANDDDDPFAGMTSDDDDGPGNGGGF
jgi:periplasmic protein CpxP/Spy